jgi:similar to stage IV sporulation protein
MRLVRWLTGWVRVQVTGAEPESFLNALAQQNVPFWASDAPADYTMGLTLPRRQKKRAQTLAQAKGFSWCVVAQGGLPPVLSRLRTRALLGLLAVAAALLFVSTGFIWDIEISGNETVSDGEILQALAQCGIDVGKSWLSYSQDSVRNGVLLRLPSLRWMTVSMEGCRAVVIVREKRTYIEPVPEDEPARLVAAKAGLITEINDLRGTAVTEVNKTVLPGETLVEGYATGRLGVQGPVRAIGTVYARTWYEMTMAAPETVSVKVPTGEKTTRFALILGKIRINFYKGSSICPEECDKIIESYTAAKTGWFALPLTLEKITLQAYTLETQTVPEGQEELSGQLMDALQQTIGSDGEILSATFTASRRKGVLYVTLHGQCQEQIATTVPLTEEEILLIQERISTTEETDS